MVDGDDGASDYAGLARLNALATWSRSTGCTLSSRTMFSRIRAFHPLYSDLSRVDGTR